MSVYHNPTLPPPALPARGGTVALPPPPAYLLADPWTEDDEALVHFTFNNAASAQRDADKAYRQVKQNICDSIACCCWCGLGLSCLLSLGRQEEMIAHNTVQKKYMRHAALSRNGVMYKEVETRPMGVMPGNCCDQCCCIYGTHDVLRRPASSKTIPFEKIQDVRVQQASGADVLAYCGCCSPETFKRVDTVCEVDTAGSGIEIRFLGLENPDFFKKCVLAMKNGRPLPPLDGKRGVRASEFGKGVVASDVRSHQVHLMAGTKRASSAAAPVKMEMSRMSLDSNRGGNSRGEYVRLVAAMESQNDILREHTALLQRIAEKSTVL